MPSIGFIGLGNMGAAMVRGLAGREGLALAGTDLSQELLAKLADECGLAPQPDGAAVAKASQYIVLAVKPQHAPGVLAGLAPALTPEHCLVSVAAGLTCAKLREMIASACPVVRVMPNTPALVGAGAYAVCLDDPGLTQERKDFLTELFAAIGRVFVLPEGAFDAYTAVVGSGPAYVVFVMEALVEAAVAQGLPRPQATDMVKTLFTGTAKLAEEDTRHLSELREMVTSPAGTTIAALAHLDRTGVRGHLMDAVAAATRRSKELGS